MSAIVIASVVTIALFVALVLWAACALAGAQDR